MQINRLFWQKIVIAFIVGFLGSLLTTITGWGDSPNFSFDKAALISLIVAALSAGFRAALALSPVNLTGSDAQHSIIRLPRSGPSNESGQVNVLVLVVIIVVILAIAGGIALSPWWLLLLLVILLLLFR